MPGPCDHICATGTEEQSAGCLVAQGAALYDQITANLTQLNELLALAQEKALLNHAESVPIAASIDRLGRDVKRSSAAFYNALEHDGEHVSEPEGDGA